MKKIYIALAFALLSLVSCRSLVEEWQPVFTGKYANPETSKIYSEAEFRSRYEKMVVKKKIEPIDTSFTQPIALYGTPNIVKVYPNKDDQ